MNSRMYVTEQHKAPVLLVKFHQNVSGFAEQPFLNEIAQAREIYLAAEDCPHLLLDLESVPFFGSTVIEGMCVLWKATQESESQFALCHLSDVGRETLDISRLLTLWTTYGTVEDGLKAMAEVPQ